MLERYVKEICRHILPLPALIIQGDVYSSDDICLLDNPFHNQQLTLMLERFVKTNLQTYITIACTYRPGCRSVMIFACLMTVKHYLFLSQRSFQW